MKTFLALFVSSSLLLGAASAFAEGDEDDTPAAVSAYVSVDALHTRFSLIPEGASEPIETCNDSCALELLPGRYTLYAEDLRSGEKRDTSLRIRKSGSYHVLLGNGSASGAGLGLGIAGSLALVTGLVLISPELMSAMCEDSNCVTDKERKQGQVGLGLLFAGAIATPVAWSLFARNRSHVRFTEHHGAEAASDLALRIGLTGLPRGGLGLSGSLQF